MCVELDTKTKILNAAINIFSEKGYASCTMKDIAKSVGIKAPSIYYFYDSKNAILDEIIEVFCNNYTKNRMPREKVIELSKNLKLSEVLGLIFYNFGDNDEYHKMIKICKIILSFRFENENIYKVYKELFLNDSREYIISILKDLREMGRIKKDVDFYWISFIMHSFSISCFYEHLDSFDKKDYQESLIDFAKGISACCEIISAFISAE